MSLTRDHLESIIWPRYREPVGLLSQLSWAKARPSQLAQSSPPDWFKEIIEMQAKGVLNLTFSSASPWVVLPEPLPGFTMVVYKKEQGAVSVSAQSKLKLRHHSFDQFSELANLAQRTLVMIIKETMKKTASEVIELENEDAHVFIFPRGKMQTYLKALGFEDEQIPKLLSIEDIETDFFNPD